VRRGAFTKDFPDGLNRHEASLETSSY
jgi:hypothetical protein